MEYISSKHQNVRVHEATENGQGSIWYKNKHNQPTSAVYAISVRFMQATIAKVLCHKLPQPFFNTAFYFNVWQVSALVFMHINTFQYPQNKSSTEHISKKYLRGRVYQYIPLDHITIMYKVNKVTPISSLSVVNYLIQTYYHNIHQVRTIIISGIRPLSKSIMRNRFGQVLLFHFNSSRYLSGGQLAYQVLTNEYFFLNTSNCCRNCQ